MYFTQCCLCVVQVVTSIEAAQAAAMQAEGQGRAKYNFTAQSSVELSLRKVSSLLGYFVLSWTALPICVDPDPDGVNIFVKFLDRSGTGVTAAVGLWENSAFSLWFDRLLCEISDLLVNV